LLTEVKECTTRLGSGRRLLAALLALQLPVTKDERGWWLQLLRRMTTYAEGR
jgi:hypothetical protein